MASGMSHVSILRHFREDGVDLPQPVCTAPDKRAEHLARLKNGLDVIWYSEEHNFRCLLSNRLPTYCKIVQQWLINFFGKNRVWTKQEWLAWSTVGLWNQVKRKAWKNFHPTIYELKAGIEEAWEIQLSPVHSTDLLGHEETPWVGFCSKARSRPANLWVISHSFFPRSIFRYEKSTI